MEKETNEQDMFLSDKRTRTNLLHIIYSLKRRNTQVQIYNCLTCIYVPDTDLSIINIFLFNRYVEQFKWNELF